MNFITIDFSLNSPGICIYSNNSYNFIGYLKPGTGTKKEQKLQEDLNLLKDTQITYQPDWTNNEAYSKSEMIKIQRHTQTANDIINMIIEILGNKAPVVIAFEGSSYGSSAGTNNIIDMAAGAAILKMEMMSKLKVLDMMTIAPSTIKKHAGSGRLKKDQLWVKFLDNVLNDKSLEDSSFLAFCKSQVGDVKKVPKPLDDLVDAYFLNHLARTLFYPEA
jgi:Holliday junction resolvasome RuvABC endonuclease subunit